MFPDFRARVRALPWEVRKIPTRYEIHYGNGVRTAWEVLYGKQGTGETRITASQPVLRLPSRPV